MASPLPFQLPALARHVDVLSRHPATLEASVPGFGKTFVAGFLAQYLKLRPAVLCPKSVIPHWRDALQAVGVEPVFVTNYEQAKLAKFKHGRWLIRGRRYEWQLPPDALLVFDEVHRCAKRATQTAKLLSATRRSPNKVIAMSATAAKDPMDLDVLGEVLGLHHAVDHLGWAMTYGVCAGKFDYEFRGDITYDEKGLKVYDDRAALLRLHKLIFPEHGYRASYDDIPGFPENTILVEGVEVEHPEEIDEHYSRVVELQKLHDEASEPVVARLRARQLAEIKKADAMVEMAQDAVAEGMSVVLFVNFRDTLEHILKKIRGSEGIFGGQSEYERETVIQNFRADRTRVVATITQAGGTGISLHDVRGDHPRLALISPPDSARNLIQALGRIRRAGAKTPALQKIIFAERTIESRVRQAVGKKVNQIETLNDGDLDPLLS